MDVQIDSHHQRAADSRPVCRFSSSFTTHVTRGRTGRSCCESASSCTMPSPCSATDPNRAADRPIITKLETSESGQYTRIDHQRTSWSIPQCIGQIERGSGNLASEHQLVNPLTQCIPKIKILRRLIAGSLTVTPVFFMISSRAREKLGATFFQSKPALAIPSRSTMGAPQAIALDDDFVRHTWQTR